jgi:3-oxoacyl-[acyl-carrier-protein] synthase-1
MLELSTHGVDSELFMKEPMVGGRVPTEWLYGEPEEEKWPGHERFGLRPPPPRNTRVPPGIDRVLELTRLALAEIRHDADLDRVSSGRYRVYLGLNELEPADLVLDEVRASLGGEPKRYTAEAGGRASGLSMLERAVRDLREGRIEGALVGGVDSLIRAPMAEKLDAAGRIRSATAPEGFRPGEAAAFVYLETAQEAARRSRTCYATVSAAAVAQEPSAGTEQPNRATGLATALKAARRQAELEVMPLVVCDLNGERPRAHEWSLAGTRALGNLHGEREVWHPADCIGDSGAAAGVVDLVWAAMALRRGYAPMPRALVWGASDGALRAAAVLDRSR